MSEKFELVKSYLFELELPIVQEDEAEELVVITDEENGITNSILYPPDVVSTPALVGS